jgi:hypothetical protein
MRSNWVRMSEEVDWGGMRLSNLSDISPVYTPKVPPYPPQIFSLTLETLQIISKFFEINACGNFSNPKYPTW